MTQKRITVPMVFVEYGRGFCVLQFMKWWVKINGYEVVPAQDLCFVDGMPSSKDHCIRGVQPAILKCSEHANKIIPLN